VDIETADQVVAPWWLGPGAEVALHPLDAFSDDCSGSVSCRFAEVERGRGKADRWLGVRSVRVTVPPHSVMVWFVKEIFNL